MPPRLLIVISHEAAIQADLLHEGLRIPLTKTDKGPQALA
jgi:hypothetical protein